MRNILRGNKRKEIPEPRRRPAPPVFSAGPETGLNAAQVRERVEAGCVNTPVTPPSKSVGQIFLTNIFTYFNLVFFVLAALVIAAGSWRDLTFLGVVFFNTAIGIIQELRAKRTLDGLSILSAPKARVVRDGAETEISADETVRDDVAVFATGDQIYADAQVAEGTCLVNEALITGEADEIRKQPGDALLSGSFVVSGGCRARLAAVGADSFVSRLTSEAKKVKKQAQSEMMDSLNKLVKWIGILMVPFGVLLALKEIVWLRRGFAAGIPSVVAALIGMIPEGLYLLTSMALAAGVVRLAKRKTLVHDMGCIETLARVDTLCVDKTGTITENKMIVQDVVPLCPDRFIESDIRGIMVDYVYAMQNDNDTMAALRKYFTGSKNQTAIDTLPFTSAKKYGGVSFDPEETYLLGAPEIILGDRLDAWREQIDRYSALGCRVLLLALYDGSLSDEKISAPVMPLALILLANKIRPEAPDTFRYFAAQGVAVKVISGDNPLTVSEVAGRAGIPGAERWVDARTLHTPSDIRRAAEECAVFGRVTPDQKQKLVRAMKKAGHTVAMTGDGVNDVLALKSADCSIAMASGSEVACQVSHIVLLDSSFARLPDVVGEGRRVINNIERSASLYLVKNIFSFCLAIISLSAALPYPFTPAQLSLISALTIGIPSFVLAMEPNESRVEGRFLPNVIYRALPAAITDILLIVGVLLFYVAFHLNEGALTTICTAVMGAVGLLMVHRTCKPYNVIRKVMMAAVSAAFVLSFFFLKTFFALSSLTWPDVLILLVLALLAQPVLHTAALAVDGVRAALARRRRGRGRRNGAA